MAVPGMLLNNVTISQIKGTVSIKMHEIDPSHVKKTSFTCSLVINRIQMSERSCFRQHRLFTFVCHYASREVICGMLTKVCRAHKLFETFVFSLLSTHCLKLDFPEYVMYL